MANAHHVLKRPLILTEKGNLLKEKQHKFFFEVAMDATKHQIREAVEKQFPEVRVQSVRTLIIRGHNRRMGRGYAKTQNWKKAIVTLRETDKIEFFDAF